MFLNIYLKQQFVFGIIAEKMDTSNDTTQTTQFTRNTWYGQQQRELDTLDTDDSMYTETNGHLVSSSTVGAATTGTSEHDQGRQPGCWR